MSSVIIIEVQQLLHVLIILLCNEIIDVHYIEMAHRQEAHKILKSADLLVSTVWLFRFLPFGTLVKPNH